MTVGEAIRAAADLLAATSDTARLDAELLMAHALGMSRSDMLLKAMRDPAPEGFAALVERRAGHEPVAYITGTAEFYGLPLTVTPATLIPRGDSETLIEAALEHADKQGGAPGRALDLGTGSGALLLALLAERTVWHGVGIDASADALVVAQANAAALALAARSAWHLRDWGKAGLADDLGTFDVILCNPPFHQGFSVDGALTDKFLRQTRRLLSAQGMAVFVVNQFIALERAAQKYFRVIEPAGRNPSFKLIRLARR
jgi:release factor glutamine methyltransferase